MLKNAERQTRFVHIAACLAFVLVLLDVSVVNVALEALRNTFQANMAGLQWVVNGYALVFAALLLAAGTLGDRLGGKLIFMAGFAVFTLASIGCGLAPNLRVLVIFRIVQGLGAALLVPTSLSLIREIFHDDKVRSRAIGWWGAAGGIALAAGPVIGGLLVSTLGWRAIFLLNVPIGLLGLGIIAGFAPTSDRQREKGFDLPGQVTGILTLASATFALTEASSLGWHSRLIQGMLLLSILFCALFLWIQARSLSPMLPLVLFRNPILTSITLIGLITNLAFYGMVFILSLYFQSVKGFTPLEAGLAFLPMMSVLVLMNIISSRMAAVLGTRNLIVCGLIISAFGYLLLLPMSSQQAYWLLIFPMLLAGSGISLIIPTMTHTALTAVPSSQSGTVAGLLNTARQMGGVIGVALFGYLARSVDKFQFISGMHTALIISALLLIFAAALGFIKLKLCQ